MCQFSTLETTQATAVAGLGSSQPSRRVFSVIFKDGASTTSTYDSRQEGLPWEIFNIGENVFSHRTEAIKLLLQKSGTCIAFSSSELSRNHLASQSIGTGNHTSPRQHSMHFNAFISNK